MKLSIITINYNNVNGLRKTIDSIVSQTYQDFEWIVIDGGSTDGSKELIEQHQDRMAYWCSEHDKGVYNAMNKGIAHAQGEYINFMNSGDCFADKGTISGVFSTERNTDIIYGYMMRGTLNGDYHNRNSMRLNLSWEVFYRDTFPHQSSYIKHSLFEQVGMYDETFKMLADWKWFAKAILEYNATYEFIPKILSIYECGGISENEGWKVEWRRIQKEVFGCINKEEDLRQLQDLNDIYAHSGTRFLYKVIRKIARKIEKFRSKRILRKLTAKF